MGIMEESDSKTLKTYQDQLTAIDNELTILRQKNANKEFQLTKEQEERLFQAKIAHSNKQLKTEYERIERTYNAELNRLNDLYTIQQEHEENLTKLATLRLINNDSKHMEASLKSMLSKQYIEVQKSWNKLHQLTALNNNKEFLAKDKAIKREAEYVQKRLKLQEEINEALYKNDLDLTSKRGRNLAKRISNEAALQETEKQAAEYVSQIPLIGVELGKQKGNLMNMFKDFSRFTDSNGKSWTRSSAKAQQESAAKAMAKSGKVASYSEITAKVKEAQKNGTWEKYQALKKEVESREALGDTGGNFESKKRGLTHFANNLGLTADQIDYAEATAAKKNSGYAALANATAVLANIAQKLNGTVEDIATKKAYIDTRLYGSNNGQMLGSYWTQMSYDFSSIMFSPWIKYETLVSNLIKVVDQGIARDAEQMAMLETVKDKIAATFNTFDGTMLRLIRIQDENTTAARLGMESSLTAMLNNMYETTEYLHELASTVRANLEEAQALMGGQEGVEFEYQAQKWLGSLYSVGMSKTGVSAISTALGQLAAGDISGITSGGASNLLIMAANNSNLSISDILANGLDSSEVNTLLNKAVDYMSTLVDEANGNNVVQQQLAKVFGLTASDLRSVKNIINTDTYSNSSTKKILSYGVGDGDIYNNLLGELFNRADTMWMRTSVGEMVTNVMNNVEYATAAGMASIPALYIANKVSDAMDAFAGGIPLPAITTMFGGVDTKLTVANIIRSASMLTGFTGSLIAGISSAIGNGGGGLTGSGLLNMVGINNKVSRGASTSYSGSGTIMNSSVSDMTDSATQEGEDTANSKKVEAQEESSEVTIETVNNNVVLIRDLLDAVVDGSKSLNVRMESSGYNVIGSLV